MRYRQPQFLSDADEPSKRVRCPIHGFIHFSQNEKVIIDHKLFRRLRYIRQLALTEFLYPGASHTRFEHSLGVMDIVTRAFDILAAKHGDLLENAFGEVEGFGENSLAIARQSLRLAALLHDVGHCSFSHAAEKVVHDGSGHEELSIKIIQTYDLMGSVLLEKFGQTAVRTVAQIIKGGADIPPQLWLLHDLVSGQMDADRIDYLLRDSHHCGVDYGKFDYRRMIECFGIIKGEFGEPQLALNRDGLHTFEALILARYQMNVQVYYHRLRHIYDIYLLRYHKALAVDTPFTPEIILANNDVTMLNRILCDADNPNCGEQHIWANRIAERRHHRLVHDTGVNAKPLDLKRSGKVLASLQDKYPEIDFIHDIAKANIHKLLTPDDQDDQDTVRISLIIANDQQRDLAFESQILSKIPKNFQCGRIFADLDPDNAEMRAEVMASAAELWKGMGD